MRHDRRSASIAADLLASMVSRGFSVAAHPSASSLLHNITALDPGKAAEWADIVVVIGGDGTLIRAFHELKYRPPILGVNSNTIGYLMDVMPNELEDAVKVLAENGFEIEERGTGVAIIEDREVEFVNEIVVSSPHHDRLVALQVSVDGELVQQGRADGLIVATPTGSTAYALSAGGPVVDPSLEALVIVPLAPFSPLLRPLVTSSSKRVSIRVRGECRVIADGLITVRASSCDIKVRLVRSGLKLVRVPFRRSVWDKLRRRLLDITFSREER